MEFHFRYEDGNSNIKDQFGRPKVDEGDLKGLVNLIDLIDFSRYSEVRKTKGDTFKEICTRKEYLKFGFLQADSDESEEDVTDDSKPIEVLVKDDLYE